MTAQHRTQPPRPLTALACFSALTIVQSGLGLLLLPLYVNLIPPADYGVLAAVTLVAAIVGVASNLKLDAAMRTFFFDYEQNPPQLEAYLRQAFAASILVSGFVYVALLAVGDGLFELIFVHAELRFFPAGAIAVATASIGGCLSVYFAYLRNRVLLRELVRWQLVLVVGTIVGQWVLVVHLKLGMYGVLWGSLLPHAATLVLVCLARPGLLRTRPNWGTLRPSLTYSLPLVGLALLFVLGTRLDRFVLERHVGLDALGAYAVLMSLLGLPTIVLNAFDNAIRPHLYAEMKAGDDRARLAVESYHELYLLVGLLAISVAVCIGSNLHWLTDHPAYLSLQRWLPLGATAFVPLIGGRYYSLLHEFHKRSIGLTVGAVARVMILLVMLSVLIPRFGIAGALYAVLAAEALNALAFRMSAQLWLRIRPALRGVRMQLAIFLAAVWLSAYALGTESSFGIVQLAIIAGTLLTMNRRALRMLLTRPQAGGVGVAPT